MVIISEFIVESIWGIDIPPETTISAIKSQK